MITLLHVLYRHLENNKKQHGFMKNKSCQTYLTSSLYKPAAEENSHCDDFSRAVGTVL